jgi:cell division protein FtsL
MKKEYLKNVLLAVVALFVLALVIWNTVALNEIRGDIRSLERDIGVSTSIFSRTGSLKSDIDDLRDDLEWELRDIKQQLDDIDWRLRFQ